MKVVEYGEKQPQVVLLLHGGGLSWWSYREVAHRLQAHYHVVLPVLDGHAESGVPFVSIEEIRENPGTRMKPGVPAHGASQFTTHLPLLQRQDGP